MKNHSKRQLPPMPSISVFKVFIKYYVPLWLIIAPIGIIYYFLVLPFQIIYYFLALPFNILGYLLGKGWKRKQNKPIRVDITECAQGEGNEKDEILFIHGWPDSGELWRHQIPVISQKYRCINVTLPNFDADGKDASWGPGFEEVRDMLADVIRKHSKQGKVTVICHDWSCSLTYNLVKKYPSLIKRIISLDIGGTINMTAGMTYFIMCYQGFNILCYLLGNPAGTWMMKKFLQQIKYKGRNYREIHSNMNYLYLHLWWNLLTCQNHVVVFKGGDLKKCPIFFGYGKKEECFHSRKWLLKLQKNQQNGGKCRTKGYECDHWIMIDKYEELNRDISEWLAQTDINQQLINIVNRQFILDEIIEKNYVIKKDILGEGISLNLSYHILKVPLLRFIKVSIKALVKYEPLRQ